MVVMTALLLPSTGALAGDSERLRGTQFIGLVKEKTLSGKTAAGVKFHIFFLRGGKVTFRDQKGRRDNGTWRVTKRDAVCVRWRKMYGGKERCAVAYFKDGKIYYRGGGQTSTVDLLAYIADGF